MNNSITKTRGADFIIKQTDSEKVFIPEEWTEEQRMIGEMVEQFIQTEVQPRIPEMDAQKDLSITPSLLEKSADLGLCGVAISERFGGMELDFNTGLLFSEKIAGGFSFATTIGAQTSIGSLPIVYYGTEEQCAKYLPGVASAKIKTSYCLTEPEAGSDANSGRTRARLSDDESYYLLNGQKMWITNGGFADLFIVFAKIEDKNGVDENLSAFIVEKKFGGITLGEEEKKMGIKGSSTVQVFFNDCKVPAQNLLAGRGDGFKIALNILNSGRIKLAAGSMGGGKIAIEHSVKYANERKQFGKPISNFGAIKHKIGEMAARTFATESGIYRAGYNIDKKCDELKANGSSDQAAKLNALREFAIECAIMKVHSSEVVGYCADEAVQIHGGMGYSQEAGVETGYRDARITRIYEGTNEINRMLSVGELMKRAFKEKSIDLQGAMKKVPMKVFVQLFSGTSSSGFAKEQQVVENFKNVFLLIAGAAGKKLKLKLVDEQEIIINLADILAEAYVCESTLLRIIKLKSQLNQKDEALNTKIKMLQLYLYEANNKVRKAGEDAINAYAEGRERKMMLWMLNRLTRRYDINPKEHRRAIANHLIKEDTYCFT